MTFPLPKNHQTTRENSPNATTNRVLALCLLACFWLPAASAAEPLDELRQRSPRERWKKSVDDFRDSIEAVEVEMGGSSSAVIETPGRVRFETPDDDFNSSNSESPFRRIPLDSELDQIEAANPIPTENEIPRLDLSALSDAIPFPDEPGAVRLADHPEPIDPPPALARVPVAPPSAFDQPRDRVAVNISNFQDELYNQAMIEPERDPAKLPGIGSIAPYPDYAPPDDQGRLPIICPDGKQGDECPEEVPLSRVAYAGRSFEGRVMQWEPSNVFSNPLYFEDVALERYGHTRHPLIQPFASVGKWGLQLVGLPYQMTIDPAWKCDYKLGYYRPGDCAPYKKYRIPWNTKAALNQTAWTSGLIMLVP